jgi:hypothetical protein
MLTLTHACHPPGRVYRRANADHVPRQFCGWGDAATRSTDVSTIEKALPRAGTEFRSPAPLVFRETNETPSDNAPARRKAGGIHPSLRALPDYPVR